MSVNPLLALHQALPRLSAAETKVAHVIVQDPQIVMASTITQLAEKCQTSAATVARFCQSLGYSGYRDFRMEVVSATSREQADLDRSGVVHGDINPKDTAEDVVSKVIYQQTQAISHTLRALDLEVMSSVVDAIIAADRIEVCGFGSSGLTAQDLQIKLARIGYYVTYNADVHLAQTSTALLGPGSIAIGVTHTGITTETNDLLEIAQEAGATTVGITNDPESPIAAHSDFVLTTQARESVFRSGATSSRIAQLAVIDVLFVRVAQRIFGDVNKNLRRTYDAVHRHRPARS